MPLFRNGWTEEMARLEQLQGEQEFDPEVIEALLTVLEKEKTPDRPSDEAGECGPLPGFARPEDCQRRLQTPSCKDQGPTPSRQAATP